MKKKLAILLTLLMVFNVFGTAGLTASAATGTVTGLAVTVTGTGSGAPVAVAGTVNTLTDGTYYNDDQVVKFTSSNIVTATLAKNGVAGAPITGTSGTFLATTGAGTYTLVVTNGVNTDTYTFVVDILSPTIGGVVTNTYYTAPVTPTFVEANLTSATITKNGGAAVAFVSGTVVDTEGTYVLTVTDKAGRVTAATFVIDATKPVITLQPVTNTARTGSSVAITATTNEGVFSTSKSNTETQMLAPAGTVTFTATDLAGNVQTLTVDATTAGLGSVLLSNIVVDLTVQANTAAPVTILSKTYLPTDANLLAGLAIAAGTTVTVDGAAYTISGASLPVTAGNHTIVVTNTATTATGTTIYTVDATAPVISGVANAGFYNAAKAVTWNEGYATYMLDLNLDGDGADAGEVAAGTALNYNTTLATEGKYTVTLTDYAGNVSTAVFFIDATKPTIVASAGAVATIGTVTYYNGTRTFTITDAAPGSDMATVTVNGLAMGSTASFVAPAAAAGTAVQYVIVATDKTGNATTMTVVIDATATVMTGFTSGGKYATDITPVCDGTITYSVDGDFDGLTTGGAGTGDVAALTPFVSGTKVTAQGKYTFAITNKFGLAAAAANFSIDKTAPTVKVGAVDFADNTATSAATLTLTIADNASVVNATTIALTRDGNTVLAYASGVALAAEGKYVLTVGDGANTVVRNFTIDRTAPAIAGVTDGTTYATDVTPVITDISTVTSKLNGVAFTSGTKLYDGTYILTATDAAGNVKSVNFTVDTPAPVVTGVTEGGVFGADAKATITGDYTPTATLNGVPYTSGTVITDGTYALRVVDIAGNQTIVNFKVDTMAPAVTGLVNGGTYKTDVVPVVDATATTITLNGAPFISETIVSAEGTYTLVATDAYGNATTVTFEIDKTAPSVIAKTSAKKVVKSGATVKYSAKAYVTVTAVDYDMLKVTKNGKTTTFGTGKFSAKGAYVVTATDAAGNVKTFKFTIK